MGDIPPADDFDDELRRARAVIKQLKVRPMGETDAQARARSCQLIAAQQRLKMASRQVVDPSAARHVNGGSPSAAGGDLLRQLLRVIAREFAKRDADLEKRLASCLTDGGQWKMGKTFTPGSVVTFDGAMWVCKQVNSNSRPPGDAWRLMHKTKGR